MNRRIQIGYALFLPGTVLMLAALFGAFGDLNTNPNPIIGPAILLTGGIGFFLWSERVA